MRRPDVRTLAEDITQTVAQRDGVLRSLLQCSDDLAADAERLDAERAAGRARSPLHGLPLVVKDTIVVGTAATAGSLALVGARHPLESPLVARLRDAGALLVGAATCSEWAGMRSTDVPAGWNSVRGQARNPLDESRSPWGSSSGCGAALAAGFARIALGTDTSGSALLPAAATGTYALRPTAGRLSPDGTVPISRRQDTVAPMAATLADLELLYWTLAAASPPSRTSPVTVGVLGGAFAEYPADLLEALDRTAARLARAGFGARDARLAGDTAYRDPDLDLDLLLHEFGSALDTYLQRVTVQGAPVDLARIVEQTAAEPAPFGLDLLETALRRRRVPDEAAFRRELRLVTDARRSLESCMARGDVDALVTVTGTVPPRLDDPSPPVTRISTIPAALAGWPQLSFPVATRGPLPAGVLVIARPGDEELLFRVARAAGDGA